MIFTQTEISGAFIVDLKQFEDDRGFFARAFCQNEFKEHGLDPTVLQCNLSFNHKAGTMRGMHWQGEAAPEPKFVRCIRGRIWDVIIDLRPGSATHGSHIGVELSAENHRALYIPPLCPHGYLTLTDDVEVLYQVGNVYTPSAECGLRPTAPAFKIRWPREVSVISERDASWPLYDAAAAGGGA
jgi:dTDP-4-dehydrorhamnose 3,5-epimerase